MARRSGEGGLEARRAATTQPACPHGGARDGGNRWIRVQSLRRASVGGALVLLDCVTLPRMDRPAALERIVELLVTADDSTVVTSVRISAALKEALGLAVEHLGLDVSTSGLTSHALRHTLDTAVLAAGLADIYAESPQSRPSLVDVAVALAEQDGSPLADRRDLLEVAADQLLDRYPAADARDLLLWVEAQQVAA